MPEDIFDKIARTIYDERAKLKPLEKPEDVVPFNHLRSVSAKVCDAFDGHSGFRDFDYQRFLSIAMNGKTE